MVEPSSLAETVTPSSFCPDCDVIAPLRIWSAANAGSASANAAEAQAKSEAKFLFIVVLLFLRFVGGAHNRRGNGSGVSNDGVDLGRLQVILEPGHAVGAVLDKCAHDAVVTGGRSFIQRRPVGFGIH